MSIEINGSAPRCSLHYAGFVRMSDSRWTHEQQTEFLRTNSHPREPEGDVDYILDLVDDIMSERLVLLRYTYWDERGLLMTDVVIQSQEPIQPTPNFAGMEWAAEAITYTWTGKGDRQIIEPRYEKMRARYSGA